MKTALVTLLFFLILSGITGGQVPDSAKFKSLPPKEFLAFYQSAEMPLLIDVREFFEYKKSRLKDAINIPSSGKLEPAADSICRERDLFLYCTSGFRSKRVAKFFNEKGFARVYSLDGGITAWKKEKLPLDKKKMKKKK